MDLETGIISARLGLGNTDNVKLGERLLAFPKRSVTVSAICPSFQYILKQCVVQERKEYISRKMFLGNKSSPFTEP